MYNVNFIICYQVMDIGLHCSLHVQIQDPSIILTTDASKRGWGAVLNGITTSGLWSAQEVHLHINILELQAVILHC